MEVLKIKQGSNVYKVPTVDGVYSTFSTDIKHGVSIPSTAFPLGTYGLESITLYVNSIDEKYSNLDDVYQDFISGVDFTLKLDINTSNSETEGIINVRCKLVCFNYFNSDNQVYMLWSGNFIDSDGKTKMLNLVGSTLGLDQYDIILTANVYSYPETSIT